MQVLQPHTDLADLTGQNQQRMVHTYLNPNTHSVPVSNLIIYELIWPSGNGFRSATAASSSPLSPHVPGPSLFGYFCTCVLLDLQLANVSSKACTFC